MKFFTIFLKQSLNGESKVSYCMFFLSLSLHKYGIVYFSIFLYIKILLTLDWVHKHTYLKNKLLNLKMLFIIWQLIYNLKFRCYFSINKHKINFKAGLPQIKKTRKIKLCNTIKYLFLYIIYRYK